jgi:hypothetical protein
MDGNLGFIFNTLVTNRKCSSVLRVLAYGVGGSGFNPQSGQTKDLKIGRYGFPPRHSGLKG